MHVLNALSVTNTWHDIHHCDPLPLITKCHMAIGCSTSRNFKFKFSTNFLAPSWLRLEAINSFIQPLKFSLNEYSEVLKILQPKLA